MRAGKHLDVLVAMYGEFTDVAVVALQEAKALHGHAGGTRDKLKQFGALFLFVAAYDFLHDS